MPNKFPGYAEVVDEESLGFWVALLNLPVIVDFSNDFTHSSDCLLYAEN